MNHLPLRHLTLLLASAALLEAATVRWSDPATWSGRPPQAGHSVTIPAGDRVILDVSTPPLRSVLVLGELVFEDKPGVGLTADWITIKGAGARLEVGTEATPFRNRTSITLTGVNEKEEIFCMTGQSCGTKFILPMEGGVLSLHGASADKLSWTMLDAHAAVGATSITLAEAPVGWGAGDEIVIAPSGFDPREAERVTVSGVNGKVVSFSPALKYRHWGRPQVIEGRTVDTRAAVGLLTRNILVQGAPDSLISDFGGHVMVMPGGFATIEGVQFHRMGQKAHKGRYPIHWHWLSRGPGSGPATGQYARFNSITDSFQRAINIHGTDGVLVEGNVAYNIFNHAYVFAEDGDEEDNVFRDNLGVLIHTVPNVADQAFPLDRFNSFQNEQRAGVFWGKNPNNTLVGNIAAGSTGGNGFFFDGDRMGQGYPFPKPRVRAFVFEDNISHSNNKFEAGQYLVPGGYAHLTTMHGLMFRDAAVVEAGKSMVVRRYLGYKNGNTAAWLENRNESVADSVFVDNPGGSFASGASFRDVLIAARTANDIGGRNHTHIGFFFDDNEPRNGFSADGVTGYDLWDGLIHMQDKAGFGQDNFVSRVRLVRSLGVIFREGSFSPGMRLTDRDGSLAGTGVPTLFSEQVVNTASRYYQPGNVWMTPVSGGAPLTGTSIDLVFPTPGARHSFAASFNGILVSPRIVAPFAIGEGAGVYRMFLNGREYTPPRSDSGGSAVERASSFRVNGQNNSALAEGVRTVQVRLYNPSGQLVASSPVVPFNYTKTTGLGITAPAAGATVPATFPVVFSTSNAVEKSGRLSYRLLIDGAVVAHSRTIDALPVRNLSAGTHTLTVQMLRDPNLSVVHSASVTVTVDPALAALPLPGGDLYSTVIFTEAPAGTRPPGGGVVTPPTPVNLAPVVEWSAPAAGTVVSPGQAVNVAAVATDADGTVSRVRLFVNGAVTREFSAPPFATTLTGLAAGAHELQFEAVDNLGLVTRGSLRTLTVAAPTPPPPPPPVNPPAGTDVRSGLVLEMIPASAPVTFTKSTAPLAVNTAAINGLKTFSAAVWVYRTEVGGTYDRIFSKARGTAEAAHELMVGFTAGQNLRLRLKVGTTTTTVVTTTPPVPVGRWAHVATTYDGARLKLYVDGAVVIDRELAGAAVFTPAVPMALGNQPAGRGSHPLRGQLKAFRFYNRALTAAEVATLAER